MIRVEPLQLRGYGTSKLEAGPVQEDFVYLRVGNTSQSNTRFNGKVPSEREGTPFVPWDAS